MIHARVGGRIAPVWGKLLCFTLLGVHTAAAVAGDSNPPNIVLIYVDDQSWNGTSVPMDPNNPLSASDFYQTPNIERLASQGMRFSNAYAAASVCSPSRVGLMTGMSPAAAEYPDLHYVDQIRGFDGLPLTPPQVVPIDMADLESLPQRVKDADSRYVTGLVGKWHIAGSYSPYEFDYYDQGAGASSSDPRTVTNKTNLAINFMNERVAQDEPFFLKLSHVAVHSPYVATQENLDKYNALPPGTVHDNVTYAAYTQDLDDGVGSLLDAIDDLGISDNTYIVYASDNGAVDGVSSNYPLTGGKQSLFEGGIRTPMFVSGPGIAANSASEVPVTTMDIYSTISSLAGNQNPLPERVEGADLSPVLFNSGDLPAGMDHLERAYSDDGALFFMQSTNLGVGAVYRFRPMAAVRKDNFKLLRIFGENGDPDQNLLFDFSQSLQEAEYSSNSLNVASQFPEVQAEMIALLDNWIEETDTPLPYDVHAPTKIVWAGLSAKTTAESWRSQTDVNQQYRETWDISSGGAQYDTTTTAVEGLPTDVLSFDGDDSAKKQFFHVSNKYNRRTSRFDTGTPDFDRSVTFELWVKLDDLNDIQTVLESGDPDGGLSLTIGDANSDGSYDDARFRIVGASGESLSVTGDISSLGDFTGDFAQLTVVFDDSPDNRSARIHVNGQLLAEAIGLAGEEHTLHWDSLIQGFDAATLGAFTSGEVGGASGQGDLPFLGSGLRGDIASFTFYNYALSGQDIVENYLNTVNPDPNGDFNGDGIVNLADYVVWRNEMGATGLLLAADGDNNGVVDAADYALWKSQFGMSFAAVEGVSVPEPSAAALVGLLTLAALCFARRHAA